MMIAGMSPMRQAPCQKKGTTHNQESILVEEETPLSVPPSPTPFSSPSFPFVVLFLPSPPGVSSPAFGMSPLYDHTWHIENNKGPVGEDIGLPYVASKIPSEEQHSGDNTWYGYLPLPLSAGISIFPFKSLRLSPVSPPSLKTPCSFSR